MGLAGAPFGLKGFIKVRPFSGEIDHLLKLREISVRQGGRETTLAIEEIAAAPPAVLIRFAGFDSPEAAQSLTGAELLVDRVFAAPLADGEFYVEDLKGLAVEDEDGGTLGHITGIVEGGGGELAEIKLLSGDVKMIPFRQEFLRDIDPGKGRAVLKNRWILE